MQLHNLTRLLALNIPSSSSTVDVKIINSFDAIGTNTPGPAPSGFFLPALRSQFKADLYAFFVENPRLKRRVMFDIGLRKDPGNLPPSVNTLFPPVVPDDVPSQILRQSISLESFEAVIWSHSHLDHVGDMSLWPNTTALVIGDATDTRTWPTFANASLLDSDFAGKNVTKVSWKDASLNFGGFPALDYFGDGSFYLLDAPGHCPGNMVALARVTRTTFVLLAGDTFHNAAQIRPSPHLRDTYPIPRSILEDGRKNIAREFFFAPDDDTDLSNRSTPFVTVASNAFYFDPAVSRVKQLQLGVFDSNPNILVLSAHDPSMRDLLDFFPKKINDWKKKGIKPQGVWEFANSTNVGYMLAPDP